MHETNDIVYGVHAVTEAPPCKHRKQTLPPKKISEVRMLKSQRTGYRKEGVHFLDFALSEMTEGAVHQVLFYSVRVLL